MVNQLFAFSTTHNLIVMVVTKVLSIFHDNPFITSSDHRMTSVAMALPADVETNEIKMNGLTWDRVCSTVELESWVNPFILEVE